MLIDFELLAIVTGINAIAALGFYFTLSSGQFSMAHGALYAVGGYIGAFSATTLALPFPLAIILGFVGSSLVGALVALLLQRVRGLYFAVATLAFGVVAMEAVKRIPGLGGPFGLGGIPNFTSLPVVLIVLLIVVLAVWQFDRSPLYVSHAAARVDQDGAVVMGVNVVVTRGIAFAIGGGIAGIAGVLYGGMTTIMPPEAGGFATSLAILLMVVIGGAHTWRGAVLGAIIWTVTPELLRATVEWRMVLFGVAAVVLMIWRPQGIIPRRIFSSRARERLRGLFSRRQEAVA